MNKRKVSEKSYITKRKTQMYLSEFFIKTNLGGLHILESNSMDTLGHINTVTESKTFQKSYTLTNISLLGKDLLKQIKL